MPQPIRVLFVCHANLCRSPMAERLARHELDPRGDAGVRVASAGTHAFADEPMHPTAARVLRDAGVSTAGFRSRLLATSLLVGADLVLTATRAQRSSCVTLHPAGVRRTFTLRQFARLARRADTGPLAGMTGLQRLPAALHAVEVARGETPPVPPEEDDLADPVAGGEAAMRSCAGLISAALGPTLRLIASA